MLLQFHFLFYFFGCWCTCGKWEGEDIPCVLGRAGLFTSFKYSVLVRYTPSSLISFVRYTLFIFFLCSCFIFIYLLHLYPTSPIPLLSLCFLEYGAKFGARCFSDRSSTSEDGQGNRFVRLLLVIWVIYNPYPTFCFFSLTNLNQFVSRPILIYLPSGLEGFFVLPCTGLSTWHLYARGVVVIVAVPTDLWGFMSSRI